MARRNIYLPDELVAQLRPLEVNVSRVCQEALAALLECDHLDLACSTCGIDLDRLDLRLDDLEVFYRDLLWRLGEVVDQGGTAEGAARVAKRVAVAHGIAVAERLPLPRPTRAARQRAADEEAA